MATKAKLKRAPGGGRKPKGVFAGLDSPLSIRMPADMRSKLEAAAKRKSRSLSQEILYRLNGSFDKTKSVRDLYSKILVELALQNKEEEKKE